MHRVSLIEGNVFTYPSCTYFYSPSIYYPEYPWGVESLAKEENHVYSMVRSCINKMGYDEKNYGTKEWNPFGDFIKIGDTVLIKPNWVDHKNSNKNGLNDLSCLLTHPSVVRAIVDFVVIALKGTGRIIIADAPMQHCNLPELFRTTGYNKVFDFYKRQKQQIEIADLRRCHVDEVSHHVFSKPLVNQDSQGLVVKMGGVSLHAEKDLQAPQYKVSEYEIKETASYHHDSEHSYEINRLALDADVIINAPKPKTHRLAGMTAACKNLVGIVYEKSCLPHRVIGGKENGGDAYMKKSIWKEIMERCEEKKTKNSIKEKYFAAKWYFFLTKVAYVMGYIATGDKYRVGSWYGNDTIWRTTIDLNYALLYADKNGYLQKDQQRTIVTIGDMIIAGQGAGPVSPDAKSLGLIMMSDNNLLFDRAMCEIMGFDHKRLPMFNHKEALIRMGYKRFEELDEEEITLNGEKIQSELLEKKRWAFMAHPCWVGHIEKKKA